MSNRRLDPRNAKREPIEKPKVEKIVKGKVTVKKKTGIAKLADIFIADDITNVKSYIVNDVIVPTIKQGISDAVSIILYGDVQRAKKRNGSKVSYGGFYSNPQSDRNERRSVGAHVVNSGHHYKNIVLDDRGEAENVLSTMEEYIDQYEEASIHTFYDLIGITDNNYMNHDWGWTNLSSAKIIRVRDGYAFKMPEPVPLNK